MKPIYFGMNKKVLLMECTMVELVRGHEHPAAVRFGVVTELIREGLKSMPDQLYDNMRDRILDT